MEQRFSKRRNIRRVAAVAYIVSSFVYLAWRLTIFNEHAMVLSTMYFVADVFAVTLGILAVFVSWNYRHRTPLPAPPGFRVDVLVPVYKEPIAMVRRTVLGARDIRYPHETWLLDDGRRPELKALADELGCRYLVRADNRHAKAGNLNHALKEIGGDFIAVFDADHIPQPHALDVTLGFFADPKVAMVQTPQDYLTPTRFNMRTMRGPAASGTTSPSSTTSASRGGTSTTPRRAPGLRSSIAVARSTRSAVSPRRPLRRTCTRR